MSFCLYLLAYFSAGLVCETLPLASFKHSKSYHSYKQNINAVFKIGNLTRRTFFEVRVISKFFSSRYEAWVRMRKLYTGAFKRNIQVAATTIEVHLVTWANFNAVFLCHTSFRWSVYVTYSTSVSLNWNWTETENQSISQHLVYISPLFRHVWFLH